MQLSSDDSRVDGSGVDMRLDKDGYAPRCVVIFWTDDLHMVSDENAHGFSRIN